jgi:hypothetical protein
LAALLLYSSQQPAVSAKGPLGGGGSTAMTGAQFEISIDGVPRTYRDRKELALLAAQILKSRNPNSVVKVKDLKTGEEIVVAFKAAQ